VTTEEDLKTRRSKNAETKERRRSW